MNRHSALVIFTNAYNIHLSVGQGSEEGSLFSFAIIHEKDKRYRPILSSIPYFKTLEEAIEGIKGILILAKDTSTQMLTDPENSVAEIINPGSQEIDQSLVLNDDLIEKIIEELKKNQSVDTSTLVPRRV